MVPDTPEGADREFSIAEYFEIEVPPGDPPELLSVVPTGLFVSRIYTQDYVLG
jgi:hypothetical protein